MTLDELRASCSATVTVADTARLLGIDVRTVSRACDDGQLPSLRLGRRRLIPREPLLALLIGQLGGREDAPDMRVAGPARPAIAIDSPAAKQKGRK